MKKRPTPGWKGRGGLANPRPPAVPATLHLTLDEYFSAAAVMGLIAAQDEEPDKAWVVDWALDFGRTMANAARRRRTVRRRR